MSELKQIIEESLIAVRKDYRANCIKNCPKCDAPMPFFSEADFQALMYNQIWNRLKAKKLSKKFGIANEFIYADRRRIDTLIFPRQNGTFYKENYGYSCFLLIPKITALIEYKSRWGNNTKDIEEDIKTDLNKVRKPLRISQLPDHYEKEYKEKFKQEVEIREKYIVSFNQVSINLRQGKHISEGITQYKNNQTYVYQVNLGK